MSSLGSEVRALVEAAFRDRSLLAQPATEKAVLSAIDALDRGEIRVAEPGPTEEADWTVHAWVKEAILLYFAVTKLEASEAGPLVFHDKIPVKRGLGGAPVASQPARLRARRTRGAVHRHQADRRAAGSHRLGMRTSQ